MSSNEAVSRPHINNLPTEISDNIFRHFIDYGWRIDLSDAYHIFVKGGIDNYFRHAHPRLVSSALANDESAPLFCTVLALKSGVVDSFYHLDFDLWFRDRLGLTTEDERRARIESAHDNSLYEQSKYEVKEPPIFAEIHVWHEKSLQQEVAHFYEAKSEERARLSPDQLPYISPIWPPTEDLHSPDWQKYPELHQTLQEIFKSCRPEERTVVARKRRFLERCVHTSYFEDNPKPALRMHQPPYQEWPYTYEGLCATREIFHEIQLLSAEFHAQHQEKVYARFRQIYDIDVSGPAEGHISCWLPD